METSALLSLNMSAVRPFKNIWMMTQSGCGNSWRPAEIGEHLDIAIDIAHGITYRHTYTDPPIIHRDIKASNILITDKLRAKVADCRRPRRHSHLYANQRNCWPLGSRVSKDIPTYRKSDIYSFGVLLVEMMTGRKPIESKRSMDERVTTRWAVRRLRAGEIFVA